MFCSLFWFIEDNKSVQATDWLLILIVSGLDCTLVWIKFMDWLLLLLVVLSAHPKEGEIVQSEWLDDGPREELPGSPGCARVSLSQADTDPLPGTEVLQAGVLVAGEAGEGLGWGSVAGVAGGHVRTRHVEPLGVASYHSSLASQQVSWANIWLVDLDWGTDLK